MKVKEYDTRNSVREKPLGAEFDHEFNYCLLVWMCHDRSPCSKITGFMKDVYV